MQWLARYKRCISVRAGPGRFTSKMDSTSKIKVFLLWGKFSKNWYLSFKSVVAGSNMTWVLARFRLRRRLRRLRFTSLAINKQIRTPPLHILMVHATLTLKNLDKQCFINSRCFRTGTSSQFLIVTLFSCFQIWYRLTSSISVH